MGRFVHTGPRNRRYPSGQRPYTNHNRTVRTPGFLAVTSARWYAAVHDVCSSPVALAPTRISLRSPVPEPESQSTPGAAVHDPHYRDSAKFSVGARGG